jgi:hypothetical protein
MSMTTAGPTVARAKKACLEIGSRLIVIANEQEKSRVALAETQLSLAAVAAGANVDPAPLLSRQSELRERLTSLDAEMEIVAQAQRAAERERDTAQLQSDAAALAERGEHLGPAITRAIDELAGQLTTRLEELGVIERDHRELSRRHKILVDKHGGDIPPIASIKGMTGLDARVALIAKAFLMQTVAVRKA